MRYVIKNRESNCCYDAEIAWQWRHISDVVSWRHMTVMDLLLVDELFEANTKDNIEVSHYWKTFKKPDKRPVAPFTNMV